MRYIKYNIKTDLISPVNDREISFMNEIFTKDKSGIDLNKLVKVASKMPEEYTYWNFYLPQQILNLYKECERTT